MQKMIHDTAITIDEASKLVKCSYHTIHRAIKKGDLIAYKPGKVVLILEQDFTDWFKSKQIQTVRAGRLRRRIEAYSRN